MSAAASRPAMRPDLQPRPVVVHLESPAGRRALHSAFDFHNDGDRATVYVDQLGGFPKPGLWYWIGVAASHPQAGAYLGRFRGWYNAAFYFVEVRRLDGPAAPE